MDLSKPFPVGDADALVAVGALDDAPPASAVSAERARRGRLLVLLATALALGTAAAIAHWIRMPRERAVVALVQTSRQVERYYERCNAYPHDLETLRGWMVEGRCDVMLSDAGEPLVADERYALRLRSPRAAGAGRETYLLTASPVGAQANDGCGEFTFDEQGRRDNPGATLSPKDCWPR